MKKQDSDCSSSHGSDSGSSDDNDDDLDDDEKELVPYRPELENITSQKILMFVPPPNSPPHPKTVYFLNDPDLNENIPNKKIKTEEVTINEKKYMFLYKAYKNLPLCLSGPMKFNGVIRSKLFDNTNIIWKLMKQDRMFPFLQELNQYQRFNHFPMTWQLSRKDNLYNNYFKLHTKFPKDYHYMPETYCLPKDYDLATEKIKDLDLNDIKHLWLVKPVASSRGRGIRLLTDIESLPKKNKFIVTHYVYNPHLINGKKYDLRLYLLVTGYTPLKIYLFDNGLARFCSEKYDLNPDKMQDKYIHLTNYSINKTSENFEQNDSVDKEFGDKWTLHTLKKHFENHGLNFDKVWEKIEFGDKWTLHTLKKHFENHGLNFDKVWEKIKDIIVKVVISVSDIAIPLIKQFQLSSTNLFELYGVDILLDETLTPWLMEVNLNPSLNCDSQLDLKVKSHVLTDIFNIIGAIPFSHDGKFTPLEKANNYKTPVEEGVTESLCEFERPTGGFQRLFPLKSNIEYYSKFIENPGDENLALWKKMTSSGGKKKK